MNIVVLGGSGFLGSHVADALSDAGHQVTVYDRLGSQHLRTGQQMVVGEILDTDTLARTLDGADVVYHYAGIANIDEASNGVVEVVRQNVLGTATVLDVSLQAGVKRVVFASTVYVYSDSGSFYRVTKQACELLLEAYFERYGLEYTILRYGSLYGPRADARNGIYRILDHAVKNGWIDYRGNGEELREFIHVTDAARLSAAVLDQRYVNERLVLTGQQSLRGHDLLTMITEILGADMEVRMKPAESGVHYQITPYNFSPKLGRKIVLNEYVDMGQGLLDLVGEIHRKAHPELEDRMGLLTE